jgi:hypothetical protein
MMIGWFEIAMDPDADVKSYTKKAKTSKARSD